MFITVKNSDINFDLIKEIKVERKTIVLTDINNASSIIYFNSVKEARETRDNIIKRLNNEGEKDK